MVMDTTRFQFQEAPPLLHRFTEPQVWRRMFGLREKDAQPKPERMISVIIPAHNEEGYIGLTLEALSHQTYHRFEIIVVANGCTDGTARVARDGCHRLIVLQRKGLGLARNAGARVSRGEILMFLDADTTLEPMGLKKIAERFLEGDAAATLAGRPDSRRFRYRILYSLKNVMHRSGIHAGSSGVIICWKATFLRVGGFDEGLEVRENSELIRRLKRFGRYKCLRDTVATTSMRRYERRGFGRVVWQWVKLWAESLFGDLHRRHYDTVR